jgi:ABC-type multidrug transport system ATPase subunit
MAEGIAETLQRLSSRGVTVIASMHCPSSTIAQHFDAVLLLTPDGRTAYHGPYQQVLDTTLL